MPGILTAMNSNAYRNKIYLSLSSAAVKREWGISRITLCRDEAASSLPYHDFYHSP